MFLISFYQNYSFPYKGIQLQKKRFISVWTALTEQYFHQTSFLINIFLVIAKNTLSDPFLQLGF